MKIFIFASAYHPYIGGAESYAKIVASGLSSLGDEVTVITDGSRIENFFSDKDVDVVRIDKFKNALEDHTKLLWEQMYFSLLADLSVVIQEKGIPDIIFANSNDTAILARMVGDALGIPVVANFHEQAPEEGPLGVGRSTLVYKRLGINQIIAGSQFYKDKALKYGAPPESVHLIHHGINIEKFSPNRLKKRDDKFRLILSGRISPRKQQHFMVKIFERLVLERNIDSELILVGRSHSSSKDYLDNLISQIKKSQVSNRIIWNKDASLDEMADIYNSASILVQPSTAEGLGLAVLEGMACGLPAVVSNTTGLGEIISSAHDGILISPYDETSWVDAIEYLAKNPELQARLSRNGRRLVVNNFNEFKMIWETKSLLNATVNSWSFSHNIK